MGRGRAIKAAVQGLIFIILWVLPSIFMLLDHNNEEFEVKNEILTSYVNFLNITRLYFISGAGREMLTYIEISKIVSSLLGICKCLPNQLLLIVLFSLECIILFFRTSDFTIRFILIASFISSWVMSLIIWFQRFRRIFFNIERPNYIEFFMIFPDFPDIIREFRRLIVILGGLLIFGFCFNFLIMILIILIYLYTLLFIRLFFSFFNNIFFYDYWYNSYSNLLCFNKKD